jgi:3-methyl-2-oxobutanoate hydroxymethyltransferase
MGHIGFTPQSVHQLGGYRVQGRTEDAAARLLEDALALQDAGAFAVVLELVPTEVAATITERLDVPTIGIGAGPDCDGQVQVFHDLLGLLPDFRPKHAGRYGDLAGVIDEALSRYADDVRGNKFPTDAESFSTKSSNSGSGGK